VRDPAHTTNLAARRRPVPRAWVYVGCLAGLIFLFAGVAIGQLTGLPQARRDALMQQGRQIGQCLFSYSTDNVQNNNAYPDGNSSTEVFQKLIDGNYVSDPGIFYFPLPGKVKPVAGQKLKPENVCFDVTCCVDADAPDGLPLIFATGYKVTYTPGAAAVPLAKSSPPAMIVFYKSNSAQVLFPTSAANPDGAIPNFIPASFDPKGKTYRQLTPDGPLP
jgi:hypothetical protein